MTGTTKLLIALGASGLLGLSFAPVFRSGLRARLNFWEWLGRHLILTEPPTYVPRELAIPPEEELPAVVAVYVPTYYVKQVMLRHELRDEDRARKMIVECGIKALLPEAVAEAEELLV